MLLGFGIAGLHYTAMQAATFTAAMGHTSAAHGFTTSALVLMLALAAGVMLAVLIGGAAVDQRRAALASDITIVANIARELCRVGDTRGRICQAVLQLTSADYVTLLEPDGHGNHTTTASVDIVDNPVCASIENAPLPLPAVGADSSTGRVGDPDEITIGPRKIAGRGAVHRDTLTIDGRYVGILAAGWHDRARRLPDRTRTLLAIASRHDRPLCVVMLDLDHFKAYNDTHGHQAGDKLLKSVAAAWLTELRSTDLLARYGGEEFIVILPDCPLLDAVSTADRLRDAVPNGVTCSAGVAILEHFDTVTQLIGRADHALYHAKASGRNRTGTTHLTTNSTTPS